MNLKKKILHHSYPSGFSPNVNFVEDIIQQFWYQDFYNSFLYDDICLSYLIFYLDNKKPKKFKRFDFYKSFFNYYVKNNKERAILQKIALEFEKCQSESLENSQYKKILQETGAPKGKFDMLWMEGKHLGRISKDNKKKIFTWKHHTLTEFLAAEYLLSGNNFLFEFQKLAILDQEGIVSFKRSWSGVLRFLLASSKKNEVVEWLVQFLNKNKEDIDDNLVEIIVSINIDDTKHIYKKIFELIYKFYFENIIWLPIHARMRLHKFLDKKSYARIKEDTSEWANTTETFVRRSNVVSIVEGMLEKKNRLITKKEKSFWRTMLIDFANNPKDDGNGVLQRNSLGALTYFKDERIIKIVANKCFEETQDSIVRDKFIQFCFNSAPNSKHTIDYIIEGIKKDLSIYARFGLYKITNNESIQYLLEKISEDDDFLKSFLQNENTFDKEKDNRQFLGNIRKSLDKNILALLKKMVFRIFKIPDYYQERENTFIRQIVQLINSKDKDFVFEILKEIKKSNDDKETLHLFFSYEEILALLLTSDNVTLYFDNIKNFSQKVQEHACSVVFIAKQINGKVGKTVYEKALKEKMVPLFDEKAANEDMEKKETEINEKIFQTFLILLEPEPGEYGISVFSYFLKHHKIIEKKWDDKNKERLRKLAIEENIDKINPREFKVNFPDKNKREFTWPTIASTYGDILSVIKIIAPEEIKKHRQKIINFIPFAFSDDMGLIINLIDEIKEQELLFVNKIMKDKNNDARYLNPGTYIYLVAHYLKKGFELQNTKPILKSFLGDEHINEYEQEEALKTLSFFTDDSDLETKKFLKKVFDKCKKENKRGLAIAANEVLITVFEDESAINWRFDQLKKPIKIKDNDFKEGIAHFVGPEERELHNLDFAKPLIYLRDFKYLPKFLDVIQYSIAKVNEKNENSFLYTNYLWEIVVSFVDNLKGNGTFAPFKALDSFVNMYKNKKNVNWLRLKILRLRISYVDNIGKNKFSTFVPMILPGSRYYADSSEKHLTGKLQYSIKTKDTLKEFMDKPIKVFISHSTSKDKPGGIRQFTIDLVKKLNSYYGKENIFFDGDLFIPSIGRWIESNLRDSKYGVVIFSEKYISRYSQPGTYVEKELGFFNELGRIYGKDFIIPVLLGIDRDFFETRMPFLAGKSSIEVSNMKGCQEEMHRIEKEIIKRIKYFEIEYRK